MRLSIPTTIPVYTDSVTYAAHSALDTEGCSSERDRKDSCRASLEVTSAQWSPRSLDYEPLFAYMHESVHD
ncbi:hypothetical protein MRX96_057907 [Rhipicephalus microplus]